MKQETYEKLRKEHNLPPMEQMRELFDIDTIAKDAPYPTKEIARKVFERIDLFRKVVEDLLQPENITAMEEASFFSESELQLAGTLYRKLMKLDRELLATELDNTEQAYGKFVAATVPLWIRIKEEIRPLIEKLPAGWETPQQTRQTHHYLG